MSESYSLWTGREMPAGGEEDWEDVCYSPELERFVAVRYSGTDRVAYSDDGGETWTLASASAAMSWRSVAWSPELGLFAAVAHDTANDVMMTSPDGIEWTSRTCPSARWLQVRWGGDRFVAVGNGKDAVLRVSMASTDGINWTLGDLPMTGASWGFEIVAYGGGRFVAMTPVGGGGAYLPRYHQAAWSVDGLEWNVVPIYTGEDDLGFQAYAIAYGDGRWVASSRWDSSFEGYRNFARSDDGGETWTLYDSGIFAAVEAAVTNHIERALAYGNGKWRFLMYSANHDAIAGESDDGISWAESSFSTQAAPAVANSRRWWTMGFGAGRFVGLTSFLTVTPGYNVALFGSFSPPKDWANEEAVLWRFQLATNSAFALEVGGNYMRFFKGDAQVMDPVDPLVPYEIWHPYAKEEVRHVQPEQILGTIYCAHANHPPGRFQRLADDEWTYEVIDQTRPALLDANAFEEAEISSSGLVGTVTFTATEPTFEAGNVGGYFRLGHLREAASVQRIIDGNNQSATIQIFGKYNLRTYGNWGATINLERSTDDGGNWVSAGKFGAFLDEGGLGSRNVDVEGEAFEYALYRIRVSGFEGATDARAILETYDEIADAFVEITAVASPTSATARVLERLHGTAATPFWSEGAWSTRRGFPRAVCYHESRLLFGGTEFEPRKWWGSAIDDFERFELGTDDDAPYAFQLAGNELNAIQWMASQRALLIGTTGAVYRVQGDGYGSPITPNRVDVKLQESVGSEYLRAVVAGGQALFMERKGRKLREMGFAADSDRYVSADLALYAEHMTKGLVAGMAWQDDIQTLWLWTKLGQLRSLTYDAAQGVVGWARHDLGGWVRSACSIYGPDDEGDRLWLLMGRNLGGFDVPTVERLAANPWEEVADYVGADCSISYEGSPASSFTGADHLAGELVDVLADGIAYLDVQVDSEGGFSLPEGAPPASKVTAGKGFVSALSPLRFDADGQAGIHMGKTKKINYVSLRVHRSAGWAYELMDGTVEQDGVDESTPQGMERPEDVRLDWSGSHDDDPKLRIVQRRPLPLEVLAITVGYEVSSE